MKPSSWEPAVADYLRTERGIEGVRIAGELSGGNANVTLRLESSAGPLVLRTPPAAAVSKNSHRGIEREATVLRALSGKARVPEFIAWCDEPAVIGRPFLVCGHVDGVTITDRLPDSYPDTPDSVNRLGRELAESLAAVHRLPWQDIGLADFGRPENFLRRQIERWQAARAQDAVRDLPTLDALADWLLANLPEAPPAALTHNDYHLDNTLARPDEPGIAAIIDWELAAIGDPLADVALLLMFWGERRAVSPPAFAQIQAVSRRPGVCTRADLADLWSQASGMAADNLSFYMCYAFWRLAAIVEGAYILYRRGKVDNDYVRGLEYDVPALLTEARAASQGDW